MTQGSFLYPGKMVCVPKVQLEEDCGVYERQGIFVFYSDVVKATVVDAGKQ